MSVPVISRNDVSSSEWAARVDLAACYRLIEHFGMSDLVYTHITLRVPDNPDLFLINPFGVLFGDVTASNLVTVNLSGEVVHPAGARVNPAGFIVHSAIHLKGDDAHCVLHTHSRAGMAVAALDRGLMMLNQKAMQFYNRVGYHEFEGMALAMDERERLYQDLNGHQAMILSHHGLLTVGTDCAEAFSLMYALELSCQVQMEVLASGQPYREPSAEICEHTAKQLNGFPVPPSEREWPGLLALLNRVNPGFDQ
ncbi:MAG: class II aldolase/adducin family protein [Bacteroidetes bacterium]|jgi:ribulose-5-phosphate 4-epimerase/fuculose-1-phosphate aldolase|nr:class II aldolase/adducin family protein [Bacteroidota bacterium]